MRFRILVVPAVLAAALTGCSNVELTATQRMNDLLPFQEELPDGYVREWIDMDGFDGRLSSAEHISSVFPSSCGDALAEPPDVFPEGTGEGAALSLRPPSDASPLPEEPSASPGEDDPGSEPREPAVTGAFSYVVASGDFPPVDRDGRLERVLGECGDGFSLTFDDVSGLNGVAERFRSASLPENGGGLVLRIGDGWATHRTSHMAWGQVGDVFFMLGRVDWRVPPDQGPVDLYSPSVRDCRLEASYDNAESMACAERRMREEARALAREQDEAFEEMLGIVMDHLEENV
ncbi:hypothetical protein [Nocardiopsis sp. NPDC057823]|uniref:hypothetical protein n=1 Tax=Nocardiopsis sp. NPDC057823 TaxID=3346256 RepID=UPI0036705B88